MKKMLYNDLLISTTLINKIFIPSFNKNLFFAGTDNGIFLSEDRGKYFEYFVDGLSATKVYDFTELNGNVFAATDNGIFLLDGTKWKEAGIPSMTVYALTNFKGTLFAGTNNEILSLSHNKWERALSNVLSVQAFSEFNGKLYAASSSGIFMLDKQWKKISNAIALSVTCGNALYVGTYSGVLKSENGISFEKTGLTQSIIRSVSVGKTSNSEIIYAGTDNGLLISMDSGKNFNERRLEGAHIFTTLVSKEDPYKIYVGTWGRGIITYYFKQTP